jgi:hypothetical protein
MISFAGEPIRSFSCPGELTRPVCPTFCWTVDGERLRRSAERVEGSASAERARPYRAAGVVANSVALSSRGPAKFGTARTVEVGCSSDDLARDGGEVLAVATCVVAQPRERLGEVLLVALGETALRLFDDHPAVQGVLELLIEDVARPLRAGLQGADR